MISSQRSLVGAVVAVLTLPLVLGILACLPVPIGDPEKSRIDADLSGLWLGWSDTSSVFTIEPWDRRTWLVTDYQFKPSECSQVPADSNNEPAADDSDPELSDTPGYDELIAYLGTVQHSCLESKDRAAYKVWQTRLGESQFLTWETKGFFDDEHGFDTKIWLGYRVDKISANELHLWMIDEDSEAVKELDENKSYQRLKDADPPPDPKLLRSARRAFEKIVKRHAMDPEMYADEPTVLYRIRPADYDIFVDGIVPSLN